MNEIKYTCAADSRDSLHVAERDPDRLSFMTAREGNWTGSAWLSPEETTDLARRLAEHVGLVVEPKPFKRDAKVEDIRKGDLVRVEYARDDLSVTRTGTAFERVMGGWYTSTREALLAGHPRATITILSRPEPEPLPTTPGAVIKVWLGKVWGWTTLGADGQWRGAWPDGDDMYCTGDDLIAVRGPEWDRFEVVA